MKTCANTYARANWKLVGGRSHLENKNLVFCRFRTRVDISTTKGWANLKSNRYGSLFSEDPSGKEASKRCAKWQRQLI